MVRGGNAFWWTGCTLGGQFLVVVLPILGLGVCVISMGVL